MARANRPKVMGILNVTPDSFWDGGQYRNPDRALHRALEMQEEGANIVDIGAESSRPGSKPISMDQERARLIPVLKRLAGRLRIPICIDTTKAQIAAEALAIGCGMINDTSALQDTAMAGVVAKAKARIILMHRKGATQSMQRNPTYQDCVAEVFAFLKARVEIAQKAGVATQRILIDPGIGFGKSAQHNWTLLQHTRTFCQLGLPVVIGISRKSFLGKLLDLSVQDRMLPSVATGMLCLLQGAHILRVHDVKETVQAVKILEAMKAFKLNVAYTCA